MKLKELAIAVLIYPAGTSAWEPQPGFSVTEDVGTGVRVTCEMHGVRPAEEDGYWTKIYQTDPALVVFQPHAVFKSVTHGEIYLQRGEQVLSHLSESTGWPRPKGLEWATVFSEGETYYYMAEFSISEMSGLFYQSTGPEDNLTPEGFLDNCKITEVNGLQVLTKE